MGVQDYWSSCYNLCLSSDLGVEIIWGNEFEQEGGVPIYCDNNSTIKLSKDPILHGRRKHTNVRFHFIKGTKQLIFSIAGVKIRLLILWPSHGRCLHFRVWRDCLRSVIKLNEQNFQSKGGNVRNKGFIVDWTVHIVDYVRF